ncbi:MAG TPA: hypothetical protein VE553_05300 [Candidatus Binatia bacterium]|nr:hypothetical protein [Candidatus Binatia bacterium]
MERRELIRIARRWWWLVLLAAIAAGVASYWVSQGNTDVYEASSRLIIGPGVDSPNPSLDDLRAGGHLLATYAELPATNPILQGVIDRLGLDLSPIDLREMIEVRASEETQILTIYVRAPDAGDAMRIANEVAQALVDISPSAEGTATSAVSEQIRAQAEQLEESIPLIEERISALEGELQSAEDIDSRRLVADRLGQEQGRLTDTNRTLANLYESLQSTTTNQVKIIEPANTAIPVASLLWLKVGIGVLLGVVLSLMGIFGYEYLSDNVDTVQDGSLVEGVPVLGRLAPHGPLGQTGRERLVVEYAPESQAAEDYRMMAIKLLFAGAGKQAPRSILLSSVDPLVDVGLGAANLAVVLAETGKRVILVDSNLHRPSIGQYFDVVHRCGLTDVLTGECQAQDMATIDWVPGLSVLPSGSVTYDAFVLLASPRMTNLVEQLEQQADIVLIAGSTISSFAHSLFMASRVGGVILLAEAGKTRRKALASAAQSLRSVEAHVIGAILQKSPQERFSGATLRRVRAGRSGGEFAAVGPNEIERALQQRGAENRERRADAQEFPWPLE